MKEINQRSGNELIIKCNCGGHHYIEFDYYKEEGFKEFYVSIIDTPTRLWYRIKKSIKYILEGGNLNCMDIGLTEKDLNKIIKLINRYKND